MQNKTHKKIQYEYKEALKQRCAACSSNFFFGDSLAAWDDILIKQGLNLTYGRIKYLDMIKEYALPLYESLSGGEKLKIKYDSDIFTDYVDFSDKDYLYETYKKALNSVNSEGIANKTPGVHKDDVDFFINGKNARNFGSQGQLRSIAVVLKLAEAQIIRSFNKENPVVLLDEVLGELDAGRRKFVIKHFDNLQAFITSCNVNDFTSVPNLKIWRVEDGNFYKEA
jgi:DNA replication and repair protein RecF